MRNDSPTSSQATIRKPIRKGDKSMDPAPRRMTGLEAIYLQKFDKKQPSLAAKKNRAAAAKFRNTLQQFVDDPELLVDDGAEY